LSNKFLILAGFAFIPAGAILIDNQNTQNISLQSLRRHVGVVSQDIVSDSALKPLYPSSSVCRICTSVHDAKKNLINVLLLPARICCTIFYNLLTVLILAKIN
jgi:hypothetical protein